MTAVHRPRSAPAIGTDDDRASLRARYRRVRDLTEALAAPLRPEDQVIQSMADVSPTKWHRGHTTWFFETFLLEPSLIGYDAFDPDFGYLFNSYYETVGPRHPRSQRGLLSRPTVEEVGRYRAHVDAAMEKLIDRCDTDAWPELSALVVLGVHHEQQHQELLLMDIKHVLFNNPVDSTYIDAQLAAVPPARPVQMIDHEGGLVEVGHSLAGVNAGDDCFAFDNESPRHKVYLEPYQIADRLVTAGEWLEFMDDGGYARPELWLSDGWYAVQEHGWDAPMYWRDEGPDGWSAFTLGGWRPIEAGEPVVHVSHYEADAFARWSGARLPTEFEWEHAAESVAAAGGLPDTAPARARLHPSLAPDRDGLVQAFGEVWQWTSSAYLPYPRFSPAAGAVGEYNGKFMSGQMVLRGGACITPASHVRTTYRNFFPPGSRWLFGGVRLAADA